MICSSMSNEPPFRCPVCRATQALSATCRRCRADLGLVARARERLRYVLRLQAAARDGGDPAQVQRLHAELRWLSPVHAGPPPGPISPDARIP